MNNTADRAAVDFYLDDVGREAVAIAIRAQRAHLAEMRAQREARELVRAIQISSAADCVDRPIVIL